jgi:hypothetical protein
MTLWHRAGYIHLIVPIDSELAIKSNYDFFLHLLKNVKIPVKTM